MVKRRQKKKAGKELVRLRELMLKHRKNVTFSKTLAKDILSISSRTRTRLDRRTRALICKQCHKPLYPGLSATVRLNKGHIVWHCNSCKHMRRIPMHN